MKNRVFAQLTASLLWMPLFAYASGGAAPKSLTQFDGVYKLQNASEPKLCPDQIAITGKDAEKEIDFALQPADPSLLREAYTLGEQCWVDSSQDFPHQECNSLKATSDSLSTERKSRDTLFPGGPWLFAHPDKRELVFNGSGGMTLTVDDSKDDYQPRSGSCVYIRQ